jgi:hypothetical protein
MSNYFSQLPDFEYVSRLPDARISDYIPVKNLFKKGKLREDIIEQTAIFTKYKVRGNDRPDNVAQELYGDPNLDWVVLASNNILNVYDEWPMTQVNFENYLLDKYGTFTDINAIHHYETTEVKNKSGAVVVAAGLEVDSNFSVTYFDASVEGYDTKYPVTPVTNYDYEAKIQDDKRNIFTLKPRYLNIAKDDLKEMMEYKKGSTQYKSKTLKTADNIRLFT